MSTYRPFRSRPDSSSMAERADTMPSLDNEAIELKFIVKKPELLEMKEIPVEDDSRIPKEQKLQQNRSIEERVFQDLTLRRTESRISQRSSLDTHKAETTVSEITEPLYDALSDPEDSTSETSSTDSDEGFDHVENPLPMFTEILYSKDQVSMFLQQNSKLIGRLSVIKQHSVLFVTWSPRLASASKSPYSIPPIPLSEIRAITKNTPTLGWHYIIIVLMSGYTLPPLYFNNGGVRSLLTTLKQHANLVKAINDPNTYLTNESSDPLRRSLHSMDLDDLLLMGMGAEECRFDHNLLSGTISKLKQFAFGTLFHPGETQTTMNPPSQSNATESQTGSPSVDFLSIPSVSIREEESTFTEVGSFELLDVLVSRPTDRFDKLKRQKDWGKPVSLSEFRSFQDADGRISQIERFRERVFYGGLSPEARPEGWKVLFGMRKDTWTRNQCKNYSIEKQKQYEVIRSQWETISPDQEKRFAKWRDRKSKIEKDVRRTDRMEHFYRHEHGEPLMALKRILLSYVMYNFDLAYCQGMSDLASPILYVLLKDVDPKDKERWKKREAEAFWCYSGMMDRVESNFHTDQRGMHSQLLALEKLLQLLDPQLYAHFKQNDCLNFFFCFRWILILFKREFSFSEVMRLWEAFFSGHRTPHFHLYVCVAILVTHRNTILQENMDFDELLKFSCDLSGKIGLMPTLKLATVLSAWAEPIEADCFADIF